jgi:hypothetical protein
MFSPDPAATDAVTPPGLTSSAVTSLVTEPQGRPSVSRLAAGEARLRVGARQPRVLH